MIESETHTMYTVYLADTAPETDVGEALQLPPDFCLLTSDSSSTLQTHS
jgi:hypothetical protein